MSDCERWMRSSVGFSAARSGAWFASTPISPVTVRVETCTTSPLKTSPSGVRTSTSKLCSPRAKRLLSRLRGCLALVLGAHRSRRFLSDLLRVGSALAGVPALFLFLFLARIARAAGVGVILALVRVGLLVLAGRLRFGLLALAGFLALFLFLFLARIARAAGVAMVLQHLIDRALHVEG